LQYALLVRPREGERGREGEREKGRGGKEDRAINKEVARKREREREREREKEQATRLVRISHRQIFSKVYLPLN